jgi:hypothetical protein
MILLILFLFSESLLLVRGEESIIVGCQNEEDFYRLMYNACREVILCRELYYLTPPSLPTNDYDFQKFKYQLSQVKLFNDTLQQSNHLFISYVWPAAWLPDETIFIEYNETLDSCEMTFNFTDPGNRDFLLIAIDLMKTYKQYISNEHYCTDYNERPVIDLVSGEFHCYCMENRECNKDGSFRTMIFLCALMIIGLFLGIIVLNIIVSIRLFRNE